MHAPPQRCAASSDIATAAYALLYLLSGGVQLLPPSTYSAPPVGAKRGAFISSRAPPASARRVTRKRFPAQQATSGRATTPARGRLQIGRLRAPEHEFQILPSATRCARARVIDVLRTLAGALAHPPTALRRRTRIAALRASAAQREAAHT